MDSLEGGKKLTNLCILAKTLPFISTFVYTQLGFSFDCFTGGVITPLEVQNFDEMCKFAREKAQKQFVYFIDQRGINLAQISPDRFGKIEPPVYDSSFVSGWQGKVAYLMIRSPIVQNNDCLLEIYQILYKRKFS